MPLPGAYSSGTPAKETRWRPAAGGGGIRQIELPEAASQTFQAYEIVGINSSGKVVNFAEEADPGADAISSSAADAELVLGMALVKASGTEDTKIPVILADDNVEFFLRVYNATATDAELQDVAVGDKAELFRYEDNDDVIQTVISAAANGTDGINKVIIVEKPADATTTDQYPGVWVKVRQTEFAFGL